MKRTPLSRGTKQMKRSGFKHPAKRSKLTAKALKPRKATTSRKTTNKGYKPPKWFTAIKPGSHGQTPAQKKYWKLVSIAVRVEDFEKYGGKCVACSVRVASWKDGQAGHYKAWTRCNGFVKYERKNLALICGGCNTISDGPINENFKQELIRRHGEYVIEWIEGENLKHRSEKMEVWQIVERAEPLYEKYKQYL